jgi:NADPH:quinone reductase-like Zn-dependent oxidoreductase
MTALEQVKQSLARIAATDTQVNAFTAVLAERSLARAEQLDREGRGLPHQRLRSGLGQALRLRLRLAGGRDLLVRVHAVSVNPVDTKLRRAAAPAAGETRILGYDAAGVVEAVGPDVTAFRPGDEVWYAGSRARPGTNAERHLVDERIVGFKPRSLSFEQAAALPLTSLTALQALRDLGGVGPGARVLIHGASGGVGVVAVQLA